MTKRFVPKGVLPALVTPFSKDGDFIEDSFKDVIDYTISKGATGVVPAGTTGEFVYMRTEERKKLLKTGQNSTKSTVELTKYAADIGCDAALVISPFYLRPSDKGYYEHYETVARKSDLPILLYNIPQCTLGLLTSNVVEDLAEIDNIVGIKDSSGNVGHTVELIQKLEGKMPVVIGHDECFLSAVAAGAEAAILASANIIPHIWLDIMKKVQGNDIREASKLQHSVQTLARIIVRNGGAPPVKAALKMLGIKAGKSRFPLDTGGTFTVELKESKVDISKVLDDFGYSVSSSSEIKTAAASNETVSVGIAYGPKDSLLGRAFVKLLTSPKIGHEALTVILEPNLPIKPSSIMMSVKKIKTMRQASLFYGPVQSGTAKAFAQALSDGKISDESANSDVAILAVDINLTLRNRREITAFTESAVSAALEELWR
ncbi:MAG: dihydrodipicolinate synthase family protein [Candidatus Thorarchaeota archaeon]